MTRPRANPQRRRENLISRAVAMTGLIPKNRPASMVFRRVLSPAICDWHRTIRRFLRNFGNGHLTKSALCQSYLPTPWTSKN
jgi:hypothetical protein